MYCSGPLPLAFEGPEQGFGGKNCQNGSLGENLASASFGCIMFRTVMCCLQILRMFMIYGIVTWADPDTHKPRR